MYRGLWNFITKYTDESHAVSIFLPVMIMGWTLAGLAIGLVVCACTGTGRRICRSDSRIVRRMLLPLPDRCLMPRKSGPIEMCK